MIGRPFALDDAGRSRTSRFRRLTFTPTEGTDAREQCRLAAIISADVAGYSRLMGRDDSGTQVRRLGIARATVRVYDWQSRMARACDEVFHCHPGRHLVPADSFALRSKASLETSAFATVSLPAQDRQRLRGTRRILCSVQGLRHRERVRARRRSGRKIHIQVLPRLRHDRLSHRGWCRRIRERRRRRVRRPGFSGATRLRLRQTPAPVGPAAAGHGCVRQGSVLTKAFPRTLSIAGAILGAPRCRAVVRKSRRWTRRSRSTPASGARVAGSCPEWPRTAARGATSTSAASSSRTSTAWRSWTRRSAAVSRLAARRNRHQSGKASPDAP